jgi:hypothetical protein
VVVADRPLLEVESNPAVPPVSNKFKGTVTHGTGGVFLYWHRQSSGQPNIPVKKQQFANHKERKERKEMDPAERQSSPARC